MRQPAVIVIAGGVMQTPMVREVSRLGWRAIVTDRAASKLALEEPFGPPSAARMADEVYDIDIYDVGGHLDLAEQLRRRQDIEIIGVVTAGADCEYTVACMALSLSLPGIDPKYAQRCKSKVLMRHVFDFCGVPNPMWEEVRSAREASAVFARWGVATVMVKATDNCGSRGTRRVTRVEDLEDAVDSAIVNSKSRTALLEECFAGTEHSVEMFCAGNGYHQGNIVDRLFAAGEYAIEIGHINPTRMPATKQCEIYEMAERGARALGLLDGPGCVVKADVIWDQVRNEPRILEMTARLSGGFDSQDTTRLATGRNFNRIALMLATRFDRRLNEDIRLALQPAFDSQAACIAALPPPGRVTKIITDPIELGPAVKMIYPRCRVGDIIHPYVDCATRPGFVIASGTGCESEATRAAERMITTEPT